MIGAGGVLAGVRFIASPNVDARPPGCSIRLLVIHNISLPPDQFGTEGIVDLFTNRLDPGAHPFYETIRDLRVSAHFLIRRDGEIIQFVPCTQRAWHCGASRWSGLEACNDFSIGVELEGSDTTPFESAQYDALALLTSALKASYPIEAIAGHSDIAPGRKSDPGPCFDWKRYRNALCAASIEFDR